MHVQNLLNWLLYFDDIAILGTGLKLQLILVRKLMVLSLILISDQWIISQLKKYYEDIFLFLALARVLNPGGL